jgi:LPS sulfotransferase NodH
VTHVDYYRLVDNPAAVMSDVHAALGIDTPAAVHAAVADYMRRFDIPRERDGLR